METIETQLMYSEKKDKRAYILDSCGIKQGKVVEWREYVTLGVGDGFFL